MINDKEQSFQLNIDDLLSEEHIFSMFHTVSDKVPDDMYSCKLYAPKYFEVGMVTEGNGVHCVDNKMIPCKVNDIYVVSPNVPHRYFLTDENESLVVRKIIFSIDDWFRGDATVIGNKHYCYGIFEEGAVLSYAMLNSNMREKIDTIWDALECELQDKESEWKSVIRTYLIQLFTFLGRYINSSVKNTPQKSKEWDAVCATVKIIEEEFDNCDISLEQIARRVFVSSSQLSRSFKQYTGQLFSDYLRDVRLKHSAKLLKETNMTVEEIISECGLRNIPTFYRNFRDTYDMTPQIYRQVSRISVEQTVIDNSKNESETKKKMEILNQISVNVQNGKAKVVTELVQQALDAGANPAEILDQGLLDGMGIIGEKFKNNEVYVPQVLVAARAMSKGAEILKPHLAANGIEATGKVCIGTVQGDLHDIGKNLVKMMMEGKGLEVIDLGVDVPAERFVQAAIEHNCRIICCSALLTTTMPIMSDVVKAAKEAGIRDNVKIMVGGAPVSQEFCDAIGADCYTLDATSAADAAVEFCKA